MSLSLIGIGTVADDGTGDPARAGGVKINAAIAQINAVEPWSGLGLASPLDGTEIIRLLQLGANVQTTAQVLLGLGRVMTYSGAYSGLPDPTVTPFMYAVTSDQGPVFSNGIAWVIISTGSNQTMLPGLFTFAGLPDPTDPASVFRIAATSDVGPVYSDGSSWKPLYNPTNSTIGITINSPLTAAQTSTAYTLTWAATNAVPPLSWTQISKYGSANNWAFSDSAAGTWGGTPGTAQTDTITVQVTDATGAAAQKTVSITTVAALTPAATPTFSPIAGSYTGTQSVAISCSTSGASIYYTTNGSTPTTGSTLYTGAISVTANATIMAIATASGFTQSAVGTAAYTITASGNVVKYNVGDYVQARSIDQSGITAVATFGSVTFTTTRAAGATTATLTSGWGGTSGSYIILFSNGDTRDVTLTNGNTAVTWTTGLAAAVGTAATVGTANQNFSDIDSTINHGTAPWKGINFVYSWGYLESTQNQYQIVKKVVADFKRVLNKWPGKRMAVWTRSFGNVGTNAITSANKTTFNYAQGIVPDYIIHCGGNLTSNDGVSSTTSLPPTTNSTQYGASCTQWGGSGYSYIVGANWWHPTAAQLFLNLYHAILSTPIEAGTYGGITYGAFTLNNHPMFEMMGSWDEGSVGFGQGGTFTASPADDPNCKVGQTAGAGGTTYVTPAAFDRAASTGVKCVCTQVFAAREQVWIGATKNPTVSWTAHDTSGSSWTVNTGGVNTSIGSCLSFVITANDGANTANELRQHINNLYLGRVEFAGADVGSTWFAVSNTGVPWQPGGTTAPSSGQQAPNIFIGGVYDNENTRGSYGNVTWPFAGTPVSVLQPSGLTVTGTIYIGKMPCTSYIEGATDYGGHSNLVASWVGTSTQAATSGLAGYNRNQITGLSYASVYMKAGRRFWQNTDSTFGSANSAAAAFQWYIDPAVAALAAPSSVLPLAYR